MHSITKMDIKLICKFLLWNRHYLNDGTVSKIQLFNIQNDSLEIKKGISSRLAAPTIFQKLKKGYHTVR